jgi:hypothetical protein
VLLTAALTMAANLTLVTSTFTLVTTGAVVAYGGRGRDRCWARR